MKIAVVFPGIGYHCDKPLLYYSKKMMRQLDFEIKDVPYGGFDSKKNIRGSADGMQAAIDHAYREAEKILKDVDFSRYSGITFISKSIGTVVAAKYAREHQIKTAQIYYTPIEATFDYVEDANGVAFSGTKDQWVDYHTVAEKCHEHKIPLQLIENANHSLETGDFYRDLAILNKVMDRSWKYVESLWWKN